MGYFDGLVDALLKKSETGEILFYPWGILGKGYTLKSEAERDRVRNFVKAYYIVMLFVAVPTLVTLGLMGILIMVPAALIYYRLEILRILRDTPATSERLSPTDAFANSARSHTLTTLVLLEVCSIGFVAAAAWILYRGGPPFVPLAGIAFFGLGAALFGFMILKKLKG